MKAETEKLLNWFAVHKRDLAWRRLRASGIKDPYPIWLAEIMLQQTTVKTVTPYFEKFLTLYPTLESLALASEEEVLGNWAGLGYYSRARNMLKCARQILHEHKGFFPTTAKELEKLAGIGAYTSAAIAAIGFNEKVAVVDGNVERVFSRLLCLDSVELVRAMLYDYIPVNSGDFAESIMDLGASICSPKSPACSICPLNETCLAYKRGETQLFPIKKKKAASPQKQALVFIYMNESKEYLLYRRKKTGLLANMLAFPSSQWVLKEEFDFESALAEKPFEGGYEIKGEFTHIFTHFSLNFQVLLIKTNELPFSNHFFYQKSLEGMPRLYEKAFEICQI